MNQLTPEPRPDINGKVTTRWVRSDAKKPNKTLASTPPAVAAQEAPPLTREEAPLLSGFFENNNLNGQHGVYLEITDINPESARLIEEKLSAIKDGTFEYHSLSVDLTYAIDNAICTAEPGKEDADLVDINNVAALWDGTHHTTQSMTRGLQKYARFKDVEDFMVDVSPYERKVAQALCKVVSELEDDRNGVIRGGSREDQNVRLRDPDLAELVMKNPERVDEIISIANERRTLDVYLIKKVLNAPTRSLSEGVL
jgi:hypothetical protein